MIAARLTLSSARLTGGLRQLTARRSLSEEVRSTSTSTSESAGEKTHFGFQSVSPEEKAQKVHHVFSSVASKYDLMNDVMSAGMHRCWKQRFVQKLDPIPGCRYIDVAGGTGDIGFRILNHMSDNYESFCFGSKDETHVTIVDINEHMLKEGEKRFPTQVHQPDQQRISFVVGDAMDLKFESESFDAYTIAFGIRNVVDMRKALAEAHRVLKPGGIFQCMEFSRVQNPLLDQLYHWYSFNLIPVYGEILAGDWKSYQYLVESIRRFPDQEDFKDMMQETGFKLVEYENLTNGIACIHTGFKD